MTQLQFMLPMPRFTRFLKLKFPNFKILDLYTDLAWKSSTSALRFLSYWFRINRSLSLCSSP